LQRTEVPIGALVTGGLTGGRVDFLRRRIAVEEQLQPIVAGGPGVLSPLKTPAEA